MEHALDPSNVLTFFLPYLFASMEKNVSLYWDIWAQDEILLRHLLKLQRSIEILVLKKTSESFSLLSISFRKNNWDVKDIKFVIFISCVDSQSSPFYQPPTDHKAIGMEATTSGSCCQKPHDGFVVVTCVTWQHADDTVIVGCNCSSRMEEFRHSAVYSGRALGSHSSSSVGGPPGRCSALEPFPRQPLFFIWALKWGPDVIVSSLGLCHWVCGSVLDFTSLKHHDITDSHDWYIVWWTHISAP